MREVVIHFRAAGIAEIIEIIGYEEEILLHIDIVINRASVVEYLPGVLTHDTRHHAKQRALARAVGAYQSEDLAVLHTDGDIIDCPDITI